MPNFVVYKVYSWTDKRCIFEEVKSFTNIEGAKKFVNSNKELEILEKIDFTSKEIAQTDDKSKYLVGSIYGKSGLRIKIHTRKIISKQTAAEWLEFEAEQSKNKTFYLFKVYME